MKLKLEILAISLFLLFALALLGMAILGLPHESEGECRWRGAMICRESWNPRTINAPIFKVRKV